MAGIVKYINVNLLGIAVAVGVCAFLYEALIHFTPGFTLTKMAAALIFIIAATLKIKDNRERRDQLKTNRTSKNDSIDAQQKL